MWKTTEILSNIAYRLLLIQEDNGVRKFLLKEFEHEVFVENNIFPTERVDNDLLRRRNLRKISESVHLIDGSRFYVDAHGIWMTEKEMNAILEDKEENEIPWLNGKPPNFAFK